jgi:hypothetical protein
VAPDQGNSPAVAAVTVQTPLVPQPLKLIELTVATPTPPLLEIVIPTVALQVVARPGTVSVLAAVSAVTDSLPLRSVPFECHCAAPAAPANDAFAASAATTLITAIQIARFRMFKSLPRFHVLVIWNDAA